MIVHLWRKKALTLTFLFAYLLGSCSELSYDPSFAGDAPLSPASPWEGQSIRLPNTDAFPTCETDLTQTMSVAKLMDIALYNNPSTRVTWHAARAAAYNVHEAESLYYPLVAYTGIATLENNTIGLGALTANNTITNNNPIPPVIASFKAPTSGTSGSNSSTSIGASRGKNESNLVNEITVSYLLFDFGGRAGQVEFAQQLLYASDWQHNLAIQQVLQTVLNAYTSYLGDEALVAANEQDLKDAEVALQAAELMKKNGLVTLTDVLQAQANVAQSQLSLAQAKGNLKIALGQLAVAIGLSPDIELSVERLPQKLPVVEIEGDIAELLDVAKANRPDLGVAIAAIKQQQANLEISYSSGMPTLTANATASYVHFYHSPRLDGHDNTASLQLNIPIFQGYFYTNQLKQLRAQIHEAMAQLNVTLSQIAVELVTNYYAFTTAVASLPASEAFLYFSERAYRSMLAQYKVGTASIIDVLNSLTTLSNARSQLAVTRTQWAASLANLAFSVGILADTSAHWGKAPSSSRLLKIKDDNSLSKRTDAQ